MNILVTGGAGFIGSHIVEALVNRGDYVRVIDDFSTGKIENLEHIKSNRLEIIKGDIRDEKILKKILKDIDYVSHQAALRSVPRSVDDPLSTNDVNISGTLLLLKIAKECGVKRVVYASSSSVYGETQSFPQKEDDLPRPISPYAVSKLTGEYYCKVFTKIYGLSTVSLRYFNVFGPRQDPLSQYAAVVPRFIFSVLKGEPLEIHGDGLQSRDFSYIDNIVLANLLSFEAKNVDGEVFNIACGETHSVLELADTICKILGKKCEYIFTSARKGDVRKTYADISKAEKLLGYKPKVNFKEGIERTIEYFKNQLKK